LLRLSKKYDKSQPDESLLKQYHSSGDLEVLGTLYARYMHLVYGVSLRYLKDREDAKDAVMQIFEKLITDVQKHEIRQFKSWLYVLTKNYCLMQIRSQKSKERRINSRKIDHIQYVESDVELHPIDKDETDWDAALKDCLEKLKPEQKKCIQLFYFKNKCYQDIAYSLKIEEKKVKTHLQNAKRNLKICIEKKNGKR
jgi:RNA polymerase sigma-70 factor (ECF subfamily)